MELLLDVPAPLRETCLQGSPGWLQSVHCWQGVAEDRSFGAHGTLQHSVMLKFGSQGVVPRKRATTWGLQLVQIRKCRRGLTPRACSWCKLGNADEGKT